MLYSGQVDGGAVTTQTIEQIEANSTTPFGTGQYYNALTALANGGQTGATALQTGLNRITTVANSGDSVQLPKSAIGSIVVVINAAASNPCDVYPYLGDAINALSANSEFTVNANKVAIFFCAVAGTWNSLLTA